MNDETSAAPPARKKTEIRNSLWCVHKVHGLGMVGEVGAVTSFHPEGTDEDGNPELKAPVNVEISDLRVARPEELPERLGYSAQQLIDLGYAQG